MSQKAVMIRVNGNLHEEVYNHVPDEDEAIQICKDCGYEPSDGIFEGDYILVEYEWLDIGDGESGWDDHLDDETLCFLYDSYGYEDVIKSQFDLDVETVEEGRIEVLYTELED